jgi:hypothetical protein
LHDKSLARKAAAVDRELETTQADD